MIGNDQVHVLFSDGVAEAREREMEICFEFIVTRKTSYDK